MWPRLAGLALAGFVATAPAQPPQPLLGGVEFQSPETRALQADDFGNPGMLWVARGESLWSAPRGDARRSCASCHGDPAMSMRKAATSHPRHWPDVMRVLNLEGRINACATRNQQATPMPPESEELLSLTAFVARQAKGEPIAVTIDPEARRLLERGRALYFERQGQLHLACNQCHDRNWGRTLLAEKVSQGHPADWPAYRLEWQALGSLQRRLRACYFGVRAELPAFGADDLLALELYLADRARGLATSVPGVRR